MTRGETADSLYIAAKRATRFSFFSFSLFSSWVGCLLEINKLIIMNSFSIAIVPPTLLLPWSGLCPSWPQLDPPISRFLFFISTHSIMMDYFRNDKVDYRYELDSRFTTPLPSGHTHTHSLIDSTFNFSPFFLYSYIKGIFLLLLESNTLITRIPFFHISLRVCVCLDFEMRFQRLKGRRCTHIVASSPRQWPERWEIDQTNK